MDELREDTRKNLEKAAEAKDENKMKDDALKAVYEANDIDVPDVMVESEIDNMMSEFDQQLRSQGMDLEGYFKYLGKMCIRDSICTGIFKIPAVFFVSFVKPVDKRALYG